MLNKYRTNKAKIEPEDFTVGYCYGNVQVLPEYIGCKMSVGVVSLLKALGATHLRITTGTIHCDCCSGRATVYVDENDIIEKIELELTVDNPNDWGSTCFSALEAKIRGQTFSYNNIYYSREALEDMKNWEI